MRIDAAHNLVEQGGDPADVLNMVLGIAQDWYSDTVSNGPGWAAISDEFAEMVLAGLM